MGERWVSGVVVLPNVSSVSSYNYNCNNSRSDKNHERGEETGTTMHNESIRKQHTNAFRECVCCLWILTWYNADCSWRSESDRLTCGKYNNGIYRFGGTNYENDKSFHEIMNNARRNCFLPSPAQCAWKPHTNHVIADRISAVSFFVLIKTRFSHLQWTINSACAECRLMPTLFTSANDVVAYKIETISVYILFIQWIMSCPMSCCIPVDKCVMFVFI